MSIWMVATLVTVLVGYPSALWLAVRGDAIDRLAGLQVASAITAVVLILLVRVVQQSSWLIVPLALVLLSFAGTLVFVRLLRPDP